MMWFLRIVVQTLVRNIEYHYNFLTILKQAIDFAVIKGGIYVDPLISPNDFMDLASNVVLILLITLTTFDQCSALLTKYDEIRCL